MLRELLLVVGESPRPDLLGILDAAEGLEENAKLAEGRPSRALPGAEGVDDRVVALLPAREDLLALLERGSSWARAAGSSSCLCS